MGVELLPGTKTQLWKPSVRSGQKDKPRTMSEEHFDEFEHYNFDQDKSMRSGHSGKQRTKKEASMNTNKHNPGGHERKIVTKLMIAEKNNMNRVVPPVGGGSSKH